MFFLLDYIEHHVRALAYLRSTEPKRFPVRNEKSDELLQQIRFARTALRLVTDAESRDAIVGELGDGIRELAELSLAPQRY